MVAKYLKQKIEVGGHKGANKEIFFQLCNVPAPNSVQNTCAFCAYQGKDTAANLHIALDQYKSQIEHLMATQWMYPSMYITLYTISITIIQYTPWIQGQTNIGSCLWLGITSFWAKYVYGITGAHKVKMYVRVHIHTTV